MSEGIPEVTELKEKLHNLNNAYNKLDDEWTGKLAVLEDGFQKEKYVREILLDSGPT